MPRYTENTRSRLGITIDAQPGDALLTNAGQLREGARRKQLRLTAAAANCAREVL